MRGRRRVDLDVDGIHDAAIYERAHLEPDMVLDGPAIVEEPDTTIVVLPGQSARVDDFGNLHVRVTAADRG
jgi:N-methylhydantoinase A